MYSLILMFLLVLFSPSWLEDVTNFFDEKIYPFPKENGAVALHASKKFILGFLLFGGGGGSGYFSTNQGKNPRSSGLKDRQTDKTAP